MKKQFYGGIISEDNSRIYSGENFNNFMTNFEGASIVSCPSLASIGGHVHIYHIEPEGVTLDYFTNHSNGAFEIFLHGSKKKIESLEKRLNKAIN